MKKITFLGLFVLQSTTALFSQEQKTKPDTMSIIIGGEYITLPVPKEGNKTTINLEDSTNIIQISVSKSAKKRMTSNVKPLRDSVVNNPKKRVSWFNEVEFGITTLACKKTSNTMTDSIGYGFVIGGYNFVSADFYNNYPLVGNRITVAKLTPKIVNTGFSFGFAFREKRRPIRKSEFYFITGTRFRYSRFTTLGEYDVRVIKASRDTGVTTYYPDSVYSVQTGNYRTVNNIFSFVFPFLVEKSFRSNNNLKIGIGMNLVYNINTSNTKYLNLNGGEQNLEFIQFQPIIKASYKRTSFYFSYNLSKSTVGYGSTQKVTGHTLYFGLAYKLY